MAITLIEQPNAWSPRGQRLIFQTTSTISSYTNFRVITEVTVGSTGQTYTFVISKDPYNSFIYDLGSLVTLRNWEEDPLVHAYPTLLEEPIGNAWDTYTLTFQESWSLTNGSTAVGDITEPITICVVNGYYQMSDGYKPNAQTGSPSVRYSLTGSTSRVMSDRYPNTHNWTMLNSVFVGTPSADAIYIPVREKDYGLLTIPGSDEYLTNNDVYSLRIELCDSAGTIHSQNVPGFLPETIYQCGVYPANINDGTYFSIRPELYPNWKYYIIYVRNLGGNVSSPYVFYNTELYGQHDCRHTPVRLGWVNSRAGWDYFNFIKKNEVTDTIERKQYKQTRWRGESPFYYSNDRVLTDRQTLVTQLLTVTSDWLQENEYVFLRSLLASNQVHIINDNGTCTPVSVEDTSFLERRERNGKLYNLVLKIKYSQDYWT